MDTLSSGLAMGLAATAAMDLWAVLLAALTITPSPNWAPVGRWAGHLPSGNVFHDDIAAASPVPGEGTLGWVVHYGVGLAYGLIFAALAGPLWRADPTFLPAWLFAIATVAAGWFLLQPGLGLGWAASRTPNPWKVRVLNLAAHTIFGLGLWVAALVLAGA